MTRAEGHRAEVLGHMAFYPGKRNPFVLALPPAMLPLAGQGVRVLLEPNPLFWTILWVPG